MGDRGEINVRDAMADLPRLLQRVKSGERLVITERAFRSRSWSWPSWNRST